MRAENATLLGSFLTGVLASACCLGPLVLTLLGISGAAAATRLAPLSPYLQGLTFLLLGGAFYLAYRPGRKECAPGETCSMPRANRWGRIALWIAAPIIVLFAAFPWYSEYLF